MNDQSNKGAGANCDATLAFLVLRGWLAVLGHAAYAAPFVPAHEPGLTAPDAVDEPDPDPAQ